MRKKEKKIVAGALALASMIPWEGQAQVCPQLGQDSLKQIVAAMTQEEKAAFLVGTGSGSVELAATVGSEADLIAGAAGSTYAIPRLGIPPLVLADGPAGLRINATRTGTDRSFYCTQFPIATLLAATWNVDRVSQVGAAMGNEALEYGVDVLLAPATNIHRNPLNGRNFEYYSEDPLLSGKMAAAFIRGVQQNGVGTSLKHFALNNQETNRTGNNVLVSERAMREIYLKPFEIAVKEGKPWTVMSSYNQVNGVYASENSWLLDTVLRKEWGFEGFVLTDWYGGKRAIAQIRAGNDLLMPGSDTQRRTLLDTLRKDASFVAFADRDIERILRQVVRSPRFRNYAFSNRPALKKHAEIARSAAVEGMVLLKNEGQALPLSDSIRRLALLGVSSYDLIVGGTGSGDVNRAYTVSMVQGLNDAGLSVDGELQRRYEAYVGKETAKQPERVWWQLRKGVPEMEIGDSCVQRLARELDVAVITIGRSSGEFMDRKLEGDYELTGPEHALIEQVCTAFHRMHKKVIVVLNVGGVVETSSWKEKPDAILLAWLPGQEAGACIADILVGRVNPSGRLPMSFPLAYRDVPSASNFPLRDSISDREIEETLVKSPNIERKDRKNFDYTLYEEGIWVGYRYYDKTEKKVSYPFGYGLSYTSFTWEKVQIEQEGNQITVVCEVKNTGKRPGKEVVQVYVSAPGHDMPKPVKELKGFAKTSLLQPGKHETISITFPKVSLASFDEHTKKWVAETGEYRFQVGSFCQSVHLAF